MTKITDINGLYTGYDKKNGFRILIAAHDEESARKAADSYAADSGLNNFKIAELPENTEKIMALNFDCDYILT